MISKAKLIIMVATITAGIIYILYVAISPAYGAEFGVALQEQQMQEGECGVAFADTKVTLSTDATRATLEILIQDHEHNPVPNARVYVEWSTRDGKQNYCTTGEDGKCTFRNKSAGGKNWRPLWIKVVRVEHPELSYFERENSRAFWVICPADLDCD